MSKPISITDEVNELLDNECIKDEAGYRDESYSQQIKRLINQIKIISTGNN